MNLTALLVDDELPILENLSYILPWEEMGIEITGTARSGLEALGKVTECHPDIILCDIRMPSMDGLELIRLLREQGETCEIILLTGYQQFEYARTAIQYNVHEYICKPIDYLDLEHKLRELARQIQKRRLENESERYRSLEMASWIRHKQLMDLLRGEAQMKISDPVSVPQFMPPSVGYTLLLVDVVGYFRHSIGWSEVQHVRWHEAISSMLREVTDRISNGCQVLSTRKGEWCLLLDASGEWKLQSEALAHQLLFELNAMLSLDSSVKARVVQDHIPVKLEQQILERYQHCQKVLMTHSESEDKVLNPECTGSSLSYGHEVSKRGGTWITRDDLELITRCIRQWNKQGLQDVMNALKQRMGNAEQSIEKIDETHVRYMLVHMLRELREVNVMAEKDEVNFWNALQEAVSMRELIELAEVIIHACQGKQTQPRPSIAELIRSACDYMNARLQQDLGIDEVSDWLGISPGYFCQLFKTHMGITFVEYMTQRRMENAALLLSTTDWSITAIGEATGFKERRYFSKVFHKHFHMKPSEYRQSKRLGS
ncbi:response regulator [Paenibacillus sp. LS1]|uniref:response regulator transcription factor n=1 Tax=Paenibacillus sp. LS1 TaxID=2992120 RepID=UPI002230F4BB|nr:response regulator [Paenibacillus sp. LS1]MCW3791058.1 response regulator [Paenibacillus sp. LS1]